MNKQTRDENKNKNKKFPTFFHTIFDAWQESWMHYMVFAYLYSLSFKGNSENQWATPNSNVYVYTRGRSHSVWLSESFYKISRVNFLSLSRYLSLHTHLSEQYYILNWYCRVFNILCDKTKLIYFHCSMNLKIKRFVLVHLLSILIRISLIVKLSQWEFINFHFDTYFGWRSLSLSSSRKFHSSLCNLVWYLSIQVSTFNKIC